MPGRPGIYDGQAHAVPSNAYFINHGDLDKCVRIRRFRRERVLVSFRAREKVTPSHPFAGGQLAENDAIETPALTFKRERAAAALCEVRGRDPGNQRLIFECAALGSMDKFANAYNPLTVGII